MARAMFDGTSYRDRIGELIASVDLRFNANMDILVDRKALDRAPWLAAEMGILSWVLDALVSITEECEE